MAIIRALLLLILTVVFLAGAFSQGIAVGVMDAAYNLCMQSSMLSLCLG